VTLPHTVAPLSWQNWDPSAWERLWVYRKHFVAPPGTDGMRVFLDFAAAMTRATVTLNGVEVADHLGSYLPLSAEITGRLRPDANVLAVIDGYLGSVMVASRSLASDPSGDMLSLAADDAEIDGDGVDATRLAFRAVDRCGAPRPYVTGHVTLNLAGPAGLIGDNPFD
jgi:hypothetical protein